MNDSTRQPKPTLLIVDDDALITDTLGFALGQDFEVRIAESRGQAVSLVRQMDAAPQLALIDLGLPPIPHRPDEGFQFIGELLAHSPAIKILVLSGQNDEANARHARALGAVDFIAKPCEPAELKARLFSALKVRAGDRPDRVVWAVRTGKAQPSRLTSTTCPSLKTELATTRFAS